MENILQLLYPEYIDERTLVRTAMCNSLCSTVVFFVTNNPVFDALWKRTMGIKKSMVPSYHLFIKRMNSKNICWFCFATTQCVKCKCFNSCTTKRICMQCTETHLIGKIGILNFIQKTPKLKHVKITRRRNMIKSLIVAKKWRHFHLYWKQEVEQAVGALLEKNT